VNADDPDACIGAARLSSAYRAQFRRDVLIDLVGYRRHGHNEGDEPAYTQPLMAARIERQPTVREQFAARLAEEGVVSESDAQALFEQEQTRLKEAHERLKATFGRPPEQASDRLPSAADANLVTAVPDDRLRRLDEELRRVPEGFTVNPKLLRQLERRSEALDSGGINWGQAEALAFSSLLVEGIPIRLTGQDTERGTFAHRHLVMHDPETGQTYTPIMNLAEATASFEVYNSPLSEYAALGFEYGYSVAANEALVLWEAQYGDFVNGAQIVVDQFLVSGLSKWQQTSRLTLLLPHGYEGNGPEHSSARLERFLQLAAQENIRIVDPTTAAQYFHLLRRQALDPSARPLVVMMPKGLLRLKAATSTLEELAEGSFQPVLEEPGVDRDRVRRLVLTTGKLYYDIVGHEERANAPEVAVARIEQLYPFPVAAAAELVRRYGAIEEVVWAQEEPQNMGAYRAIRHRLEEAVAGRVPLRYAGRPWRASPSEGYPTAHLYEQDRIVRAVLER
jgi:2-oxoglutarate dehydrogenase complex dehydrogenase (E1) component-like enzyme